MMTNARTANEATGNESTRRNAEFVSRAQQAGATLVAKRQSFGSESARLWHRCIGCQSASRMEAPCTATTWRLAWRILIGLPIISQHRPGPQRLSSAAQP